MNRLLRVIIAEPSAVVAEGLRVLLDDAGGFRTVGVLGDLSSLECRVKVLDADIVILNPSLLDARASHNLKAAFPSLQQVRTLAIIYGMFDDDVLRQFDGVAKIVDSPSSIAARLRHIAADAAESRADNGYELTEREREILMQVARGRANKDIADEYNISIHTVISHRKNITRKTGIKSVAGLTVYALLNNLIESSEVE